MKAKAKNTELQTYGVDPKGLLAFDLNPQRTAPLNFLRCVLVSICVYVCMCECVCVCTSVCACECVCIGHAQCNAEWASKLKTGDLETRLAALILLPAPFTRTSLLFSSLLFSSLFFSFLFFSFLFFSFLFFSFLFFSFLLFSSRRPIALALSFLRARSIRLCSQHSTERLTPLSCIVWGSM